MANPTGTNNQIPQRFAPRFIDGLEVSWLSNTSLSVTSGQCRDSTNTQDMVLAATTTLDATQIAVLNGSSAALANSTKCYVFLIGNSDNLTAYPTGLWLDTSATPTLPTGYDMFRFIDNQWTNGSAQFLLKRNHGRGNLRTALWDALVATAVTTGAATTATAIDVSAGIPAINTKGYFLVTHSPAAAGGSASVVTYGSTSTTAERVTGSVASQPNSGMLQVMTALNSGVASVSYFNSAGSGSTKVEIAGYDYSL